VRKTLIAAVAVLAGGVLAGCSSAVPQADVEEQISSLLEKELGTAPEDVSCPEDLNAEKGEKMTCTATIEGTEYPIAVNVTSVEGDTANFDIEVLDPEA
jgi:hypothetical protein